MNCDDTKAGWFAQLFDTPDHDYQEVARTYAPGRPVQAWELNMIHDTASLEREGRLQQEYVHRTLHGVTTILMRCSRCKREYKTEMIGRLVNPSE